MTADEIAQFVAGFRRDCRLPADPERRGPVPLDRFFDEVALSHFALPALSRKAVADHLRGEGVPVGDLGDAEGTLAGFIFVAGRTGWAFVAADNDNPLPRRRFTAAHELGHFVLHHETMGAYRADTSEMLREADEDAADGMEREANRFAAELLMPAEVCRARADELVREHGACPRGVLEYRLAAELLVSGEAIRYRLNGLGVGDE